MNKRILYRATFLIATIFVIPLAPILIIFAGVSTPEYVIKGTLNMDISQAGATQYSKVYLGFLSNLLRLNFGTSTASGTPAMNIVLSGFLESLKLIIPAMILSYIVGTIFGVQTEKSKRAEGVWNWLQVLFYIPMIVVSYLLLYCLGFLGIDLLSNVKYLAAITVLSIYPVFVITHSLKKTLQELGNSDFFLFHRSQGFSSGKIWKKFCFKFIVIDYLSFFENLLIFMLGFLYFVETPFGIQGIGYKFVIAIQRFDYPVIVGFCIFGILLLSLVGLIAEAMKLKLDPR
jgi:peptide/nickel transport system permease protein